MSFKPLAAALLLVLIDSPVQAHEIKIGNLVIVHPMVDEANDGQALVEGSMEIRNEGDAPERLLSISSEFAAQTEIDGGATVEIPPKGRAAVLMLFKNIKQKLSEDEAYAGELSFEKAGKVKIDLMVHTHKH